MTVLGRIITYNYFIKAQLLLGFLFFHTSCEQQNKMSLLTGNTMGTTYSIKIIQSNDRMNIESIKKGVDSVLIQINNQMSTWDPESELSAFNRWTSIKAYPVSQSLLTVIDSSLSISKKTGGLFDISVYELMGLWGFGPNPKIGMPSLNEIQTVLASTGYDKVMVDENTLIKTHPNVKLDLNAIAKGYAVDMVYEYLSAKGFDNIFVEIGGEVRSKGKNQNNIFWSIGIENPSGGNKKDIKLAAIIDLNDHAMATSGNYKNIVNIDGEILGHTINPRTGFPIQTNVLSVTVLSSSSMIADGWATALMVMDYQTGLDYIKSEKELEAIWIIEGKDGTRKIGHSPGVILRQAIYDIKE